MSIRQRGVPDVSERQTGRLGVKHYDVHGAAKLPPSERDQNFLIQSTGHESFVLKIANTGEQESILDRSEQRHGISSIQGHRRIVS